MRMEAAAKFIIWLGPHLHHYDPEYNYLVEQLKTIIKNVTLFQNIEECIAYLQL